MAENSLRYADVLMFCMKYEDLKQVYVIYSNPLTIIKIEKLNFSDSNNSANVKHQ